MARHPDLVTPTRESLEATGVPWVMEYVPRSPLRAPVVLCGTMFRLRAIDTDGTPLADVATGSSKPIGHSRPPARVATEKGSKSRGCTAKEPATTRPKPGRSAAVGTSQLEQSKRSSWGLIG